MRKHALLWIMLIAFCFIGLPIVNGRDEITGRVIQEIGMIEKTLGRDDTNYVVKTATDIYNALFVDSGFIRTSKRMQTTKEEKVSSQDAFGGSVRSISDKTDDYLLGFSALCYTSIVRLAILFTWLPYIAPYLVAVAIDASMVRKVKFYTFGESSRVQFLIAAHILIAMLFLPLLYLVVPLPVTPLFIPFWTLAASVPIVMVISNTQRI